MGELFGLPAHPMLVHIPVVLLPLLAAGAIAMAAKPRWRLQFSWALLVATLVTALASIWATQSGESLLDALQPALGTKATRHSELGDQTALIATIFFVGAGAMTLMDRWYLPRRARQESTTRAALSPVVLASVVAAVGVLAAVWVIRTGHEGARITWNGVEIGG